MMLAFVIATSFFIACFCPCAWCFDAKTVDVELGVDGQKRILQLRGDEDVKQRVLEYCAELGLEDVGRCARNVHDVALDRLYFGDQNTRCLARSVMVVAHPDDELIFGYDTVARQSVPGECWTIICVTSGYEEIKRRQFTDAMHALSAQLDPMNVGILERFEIWNYFSCHNCVPFRIYTPGSKLMFEALFENTLDEDIRRELQRFKFRRVVTHNANGEYGHEQHKAIYHAVMAAFHHLKLDVSAMHVFQPRALRGDEDPPADRDAVFSAAYDASTISFWGRISAHSVPVHAYNKAWGAEWCIQQKVPVTHQLDCGDVSDRNDYDEIEFRVLDGLYLGWLGYYNAGDDLLYHVASRIFAQRARRFDKNVGIALTWFYPPNPCNRLRINIQSYDFLVLGGGTILMSSEYACIIKEAVTLGVPIFSFGAGWARLRVAPHLNIEDESFFQSIAVALSVRNETDPLCTLGLSAAHAYGGVRGPISMAALQASAAAQGISKHELSKRMRVLGDAGILYPLHKRGAVLKNMFSNRGVCAAEENCSSSGQGHKPIVAINFGHNRAGRFILHSDPLSVSRAYVNFINHLSETNLYHVVVYVIQGSDLQHLEYIIKNVKQSTTVTFLGQVLDATAMFELLSLARYCVNYKLHASISCHRAGVVSLDVPYSRKYNDWREFAKPGNLIVSTDRLERDEHILSGAFDELVALYGAENGNPMLRWKANREETQRRTRLAYNTAIDAFLHMHFSE